MNYSYEKTTFVRCLKCGKILKFSPNNTSVLIDHIRRDHPEIQIVNQNNQENTEMPEVERKTSAKCQKCCRCKKCRKKDEVECQNSDDSKGSTKVLYKRCYQMGSPSQKSPCKRKLYRTSVEKWRPAKGTIYCPSCGCNKVPYIKSRGERLSDNACCAKCVFSCWPFCFLPCIFNTNSKEYLYCSNCKCFLGLYDRDQNCVRPNKKYMPCGETIQTVKIEHTKE